MNIQIPQPVQILKYPLPDGSYVSSEDEYIAAVTGNAATRLAGAYIAANADSFSGRGLSTRAMNLLVSFLKWQTVHNYKGTLEAVLAEYDAAVAAAATEAPAAPAAPAAVPEAPEVPVAA